MVVVRNGIVAFGRLASLKEQNDGPADHAHLQDGRRTGEDVVDRIPDAHEPRRAPHKLQVLMSSEYRMEDARGPIDVAAVVRVLRARPDDRVDELSAASL